jgi:hypothetical protein
MSEIYPIPKFAAYIWLTGDSLAIGLPPGDEAERGHTVLIPLAKLSALRPIGDWEHDHGTVDLSRYAATVGFTTLIDLLRERERVGRVSPRLGERSEPTQYNIDALLRHVTKYNSRGEVAATTLEDLGLGEDF